MTFEQWVASGAKMDEIRALKRGYEQALGEGWQGSLDDFLDYNAALYATAEEDDPRHRTYFYTAPQPSIEALRRVRAGK